MIRENRGGSRAHFSFISGDVTRPRVTDRTAERSARRESEARRHDDDESVRVRARSSRRDEWSASVERGIVGNATATTKDERMRAGRQPAGISNCAILPSE